MSVIDEVKQRTDIVEVIGQYTTLTKAGRTFRGLCPFHSEKHPSFFVYPEQQSWHCFGACGTGGDVFSFLMKKQDTDFAETLRLLAQRAGVIIPSRFEKDTGKKDEKERLYQANEAASRYFHNLLLNSPAGEKARKYLASRGLSAKTIADFRLGFSLDSWEALKKHLMDKGYKENELLEAGLIIATEEKKTHDRFRNRLMFPINDARGHVTGFGARVLPGEKDDSMAKYLNSPQTPTFDKSSSLYGINMATAAIKQLNQAVIVEGYMDVVIPHQYGFNNVVAAMGTSITEKQMSALKRLTRNMVLALDADNAGEEAMLRCVDYENSLDAEVKVAILPEGKDPDEVIIEDTRTWQHLLDEALPVIDYTFDMVTAKLDLTTARDKSLAREQLLPIIAKIKDSTRQDHYLTKLAKSTGTTYRNLEATLGKIKTKPGTQAAGAEAMKRALQPLRSSPLEEYCLALLLRHPELKDRQELLPEYFENSENREIFVACQQTDDPDTIGALKDKLDAAIQEHLESLINKNIPVNQTELRYADYVLNLRKKYFQNLEAKKAEVLALEAEVGGSGADLARLQEEGIEPSIQLREVFAQKARRGNR